MIDTHCHLLPGLDDGPATMEDAIELAGLLVAGGVASVLCTPHYSRQFPTNHAAALERHAVLRGELAAAGVELATAVAAEVSPAFAVSAPLDELVLRSVGGRFLVVEVLADSPTSLFALVGERLGTRGLVPIFGHPERSRAVQRHPSAVDQARRDGALVQLVAPSLLGRWGPQVARAALELLDTGRADLLASDAHGARRRRAHLAAAGELVEQRLGGGVLTELTERGPEKVLAAARIHA
jgi:protein-tyrosine phosphatase